MKVNLISDLHIDKGVYGDSFCIDCDLIIIAGDVASASKENLWKEFLKELPKSIPIIILLGNHEYVNYAYNLTKRKIIEFCATYEKIKVVDNETIIIEDTRFICSTLWSDFLGNGQDYYQENKNMMEKFFPLEYNYFLNEETNEKQKVDLDWIEQRCVDAKMFIEGEVETPFFGNTVVVTHFAPFVESRENAYKNSNFSSYWVNSLEYLQKNKIDYWFHGHIHESKDYVTESGIRVVANPRGNMKKTVNKTFNPLLILDI